MTCIIGVFDKEKDCVFIGADSLGSNGYSQALYKNKKVFKAKDNKNILMAISGDYKLQNILSIEENLIEEIKELKNEINFEHIVKYTVPKMMKSFDTYGCTKVKEGCKSICGDIIFGYKNQLYIIEENGQVLEPEDDYVASGSGWACAIAVLSQNQNKDTVDRIKEGLEAAEKHGCGIKRPFYILNTKDDEIITIK